ncbi:3-hydroxyisobutyrate dehydrogenase-like beta-hydroxyacid dehydrogenase [Rhodococcus sp. LBL1]|nr:3-hydroxyisobutyrate dehydrogenase-like beta-hydroxyacid dehydrogenase [Rhodococcus sp. LBL1]MDH6681840.1 3-hydroxyisobutyrate dehydrogenase-like beta-hydroxyacid dehydrogenase [Rhodococcus sp. LBL2]
MDIGFLGMGTMGRPMARNLARADYDVTVWNRSPGKAASVVDYGASEAPDLSDVLHKSIVCSALADDRAFADSVLSTSSLQAAKPGSVHVNLATVSPGMSAEAESRLAERGIFYVAAPVFGRAEVAEAGELTVLVAGDSHAIDEVTPLLDVIGRRTWRVGDDPKQANVVKILGNYLVATAIQSMAEATTVAEKVGGSPELLMKIMNDSLFPGGVYEGYGTMIAQRRYEPAGFRLPLGLKDVRLALSQANDVNIGLPFGSVLENVFLDALAHGQAEQDWSAITEATRRRAGLDVGRP